MCAKTRQKVFKFEINEIDDISRWGLKTVLMENNIDYSHQIITRGVFQHIIEQMGILGIFQKTRCSAFLFFDKIADRIIANWIFA